ncbi:hypothetical protein R1sor_022046 [Riccia sorocarpa]|uniref:Uncharacterized protein n=1 Tax=Riccia sorocarpa TaxID=122646 RepID=A0ABD3GM25_9MARC
MQAWTDYINVLQENRVLHGIYLPQADISYIQWHFADDTPLMLRGDTQNLVNAKQAIARFGAASGLTVQWSKSLATWISPSQRPIWKWLADQEDAPMLGFNFTDALHHDAIFQKYMDKIETVLNDKKLTSQSLQGRVRIANHVIGGVARHKGSIDFRQVLESSGIINYVLKVSDTSVLKHLVSLHFADYCF